jgi:hypothetical protein
MRRLYLTLMLAFCAACGHVANARPTPVDTLELQADVGGPLFNLGGSVLPMPLVTAGASYGLAERFDVSAHAHVTPLLFGVAGLDVGSTVLLLDEKRPWPALAMNGRLYGFSDFKHGERAYAELGATASYLFRDRFMPYLGATGLAQFNGRPLWSVQVGNEFRFTDLSLQLEARWYEPHVATRYMVVDWAHLGLGRGAFGIIGAIAFRFGGGKDQ